VELNKQSLNTGSSTGTQQHRMNEDHLKERTCLSSAPQLRTGSRSGYDSDTRRPDYQLHEEDSLRTEIGHLFVASRTSRSRTAQTDSDFLHLLQGRI